MTHSPRVKCVVNTCTHYLPGDVCGADVIHIWHQQEGKMSRTIDETECKSFHKNENLLDMAGAMHNVNADDLITAPFLSGKQLSPGVKCIVSTCEYWQDGDICLANAIEVTGRDAQECEHTNCQTFAMSEKGQQASSNVRVDWDDKYKRNK